MPSLKQRVRPTPSPAIQRETWGLKRGPLALQLASALHYMHQMGIVHLDVKPKNVIMGGPPRLIDLSVAQSCKAAAGLDVPTGTHGYMSPEQQHPMAVKIGPGSDVWNLGATLFEAATGRLPLPGTDEQTLSRRKVLLTKAGEYLDDASVNRHPNLHQLSLVRSLGFLVIPWLLEVDPIARTLAKPPGKGVSVPKPHPPEFRQRSIELAYERAKPRLRQDLCPKAPQN